MGVAGVLVPPDDYWPRVHALLREHGIYLILDEVATGCGRVGEWYAAQRFGLEPDIFVTAKGLTSGYAPLGATLVSEEIADAITSGSGFPHGFTYTGHPTSCAVALANLDIIEREGLIEQARQLLADGRLARAHRADQKDVPAKGLRAHDGSADYKRKRPPEGGRGFVGNEGPISTGSRPRAGCAESRRSAARPCCRSSRSS